MTGIHPTAFVHPDAVLGARVRVGAFSVVHADGEIGDDVIIGDHCSIGIETPLAEGIVRIGPNSIIRSHAVIYRGSEIGPRLETGHHVVIREKSFIGANLRVGNFSDIEGSCSIGDFCRFHGYVHVGKGSKIGNFVWLYSLTTATNDPLPPSHLTEPVEIRDGAVVCVGVTLMPGTVVGQGAFLTAGSTVSGSVPDAAVVAGPQGRVMCHVSKLAHHRSGLRHPWMRHLKDIFPAEAQDRLEVLGTAIGATRVLLGKPAA